MNGVNTILEAARSAVSLLYPIRCAACNKTLAASSLEPLCTFCASRIAVHPRPYCAICGRTMRDPGPLCRDCAASRPAYAIARSACAYDDTLKELVHHFKYNNLRSLSGRFVGLMADFMRDEPSLLCGADIITFVPLHRSRLIERGFNQSKMLAAGIASRSALGLIDALEKHRATKHQNELSREKRLGNLKGAFRIRASARAAIEGRAVLLIDDVMTTGATLDECARTLLDAGASEVRCLTLARGI